MDDNKILFVDLDGTLIKEDLSNLAFMDYLKKKPFKTLYHLIVFLFKGKPYLKEIISKDFRVPVESLTFNKGALDYVRDIKNRHRVVYLISGSHQILVDQFQNHLKIFFEAFGTNKKFNMVGQNKVKFINESLDINNFDYFGNSKKDLPIWNYCKRIIYTNVSDQLRIVINSSTLEKIEVKESFK
jgi:phosphoserine phosphatase